MTAMIDSWAREADPSLVRYLITQLLAVLGGPYSPAFASWLLSHMVCSGIRRARESQRTSSSNTVALLHEFADACTGLEFMPLLGVKEAALLQDLQSQFR